MVVNALYGERFDAGEIAELDTAAARTRSPLVRSALKAALSEHARVAMQREQYQRLRDELDVPIVQLPYVFADHLGLEELEGLADELEAALPGCGRRSSAERTAALPARSPDSIAPSMNPDHPLAMSDPARSTRPSALCIAAWWCSYQPGRWIAQVPPEKRSASQSWAVAAST